jgi:hypothetical protein
VRVEPGSEVWRFFEERYDACGAAALAQDAEAFVAAFGPEAVVVTATGRSVRFDETTDFWAWRFGPPHRPLTTTFELLSVEETAPGEWVVEFREQGSMLVGLADGRVVERTWRLHNRNTWRRTERGVSVAGAGEELAAERTLDGEPLTDDADDPVGFAAWASRWG